MHEQPRNTRQKVIGFFGAVTQEVVSQRLAGVIRYVDEHDGALALRDFRYRSQYHDIEHNPPPPWTGIADGVLVCFGVSGSADAMGAWLESGGAPVVSLVKDWSHPRIPVVDTDSHAAVIMAADYFLQRGYRHFAFVGDGFSLKDTPTRREQFAARLAERGFSAMACDLTFHPNGSTDDLNHIVQEKSLIAFLKKSPKPLALFALNDNYARAVCLLCERMKLRVPDDVAVLGSGNFTASRCHVPTISTVMTPNEQIGYEAARLLHRIMNGSPRPKTSVLLRPHRVIERQSTSAQQSPRDEMLAAAEYIRDYACDGINVDEVVRSVSLSRRAFELRFTERYGETPKLMIQRVRLERAKQLLESTQLSITQVAMMIGFADLAAFANFFKKQTGSSPTEWRDSDAARKRTRKGMQRKSSP